MGDRQQSRGLGKRWVWAGFSLQALAVPLCTRGAGTLPALLQTGIFVSPHCRHLNTVTTPHKQEQPLRVCAHRKITTLC